MSSINKVILIGNLGADPELNHTGSGIAVANLSLATSTTVKDEEKTEWHRVVAWDKTAENVAKYMKKGSKLYVEGRLQTRSFENKDGNTQYTTEVVAERVAFLDKPGDAGASVKKDSSAKATVAAGRSRTSRKASGDDDLPF